MIPQALSVQMPIKPESAGWAREAITEFRDHLAQSAYVDLQLMVSELIADAIRSHPDPGTEKIRLRVELADDLAYVSVRDGASPYWIHPKQPLPGDRGWGLHLIRMLADRWGISHDGDCGGAWFQMRLGRTVNRPRTVGAAPTSFSPSFRV